MHGPRLGSSLEDVTRLLPSIRSRYRSDFTPDETGITGRIEVPIVSAEEEDRFPGIGHMNFKFLDNRVAYFDLNYRNYGKWRDADSFVLHISKTFGLPSKWQAKSKTQKSIKCEGFEVSAEVIMPIVTNLAFEDLLAKQEVARRAATVVGDNTTSNITRPQPRSLRTHARMTCRSNLEN